MILVRKRKRFAKKKKVKKRESNLNFQNIDLSLFQSRRNDCADGLVRGRSD